MRDLGKVVVTIGVHEAMKKSFSFMLSVESALGSFRENDWGKLSKDDADMNFMALEAHERVLGAYESPDGEIWLITDFYPRESYIETFGEPKSKEEFIPVTTVLFPSEY